MSILEIYLIGVMLTPFLILIDCGIRGTLQKVEEIREKRSGVILSGIIFSSLLWFIMVPYQYAIRVTYWIFDIEKKLDIDSILENLKEED